MISEADQKRIAFAQKLLDAGKLNATRFNDPEFLSCAMKHGLLRGTASLEDAYAVFGKILRNETLRPKRAGLGMVAAIESLTPAELRLMRENITGVVPFKGAK
jgi:hypothetical protein